MNKSLSTIATLVGALLLPICGAHAQDRGDPKYQAGARNIGAPVREDLVGLDAMARAKAVHALSACADPYNFPYSSSSADPPGFDIEILRAVGKRAGLGSELFWVDTGTRGGFGRAFRTSIDEKKCSIFLSLSVGDDDETKQHKLVFTHPYMTLGYILVTTAENANGLSLEQLKKDKAKIGVAMSTPMDDYLFTNGFERELYFQNRRVLEGLEKGEVKVAMIWASALAEARRDYPKLKLQVAPGFELQQGLRWNMAFAVPESETELKKFLDESLDELVKNGEIKRIVESYGIPFYAPVN